MVPCMESAGDVIRAFRELAKLSQEDVALGVGVSFGAVSQWETGRVHPRRAVSARLDKFLGADGAIMGALGYAMPTDVAGDVASLRDEVRALREEVAELRKSRAAAVAGRRRTGARPTRAPTE
jgi:transcriptional regulator with XRE-family HTH domain